MKINGIYIFKTVRSSSYFLITSDFVLITSCGYQSTDVLRSLCWRKQLLLTVNYQNSPSGNYHSLNFLVLARHGIFIYFTLLNLSYFAYIINLFNVGLKRIFIFHFPSLQPCNIDLDNEPTWHFFQKWQLLMI